MKNCSTSHIVNLLIALVVLVIVPAALAQQQMNVVPTLVNFGGMLSDANGKPLTGTVGVTFYLYKDEKGGSPLWMETQNLQPDKSGHYTVVLGSTTSQGLPTNLFASGEARWLGVQAQGQAEQPRVLLLSVPYALKAGDAQTVGGLSPSAFVLAAPRDSGSSTTSSSDANSDSPPLGGTGTTSYLPIWTNPTTLGSSVLFQSGTGSKAKVGIGTAKPASTLDVKGGGTIRGLFSLPAIGTATSSSGFTSQPMDLAASAFNSGTSTAVAQTFQWQAEPVGNNTSGATGSLNLLFAQGTGKATETGLNIASNGQITFAPGQTFPGTGNGTITGVTAGTDLTGGGNSGNVTLNLDTTKVPQLNAANTFTGNQTINGNVSDSGNISATGSITGQSGVFSANNSTQVVNVTQSGGGSAIAATTTGSAPAPAILGSTAAATGISVQGQTSGANGVAVVGLATNTNTGAIAEGVVGLSFAPAGVGVLGQSDDTAGAGTGLYGYALSPRGFGLYALETGTSGVGAYGMWQNASTIGTGSKQIGVWGDSANGDGLLGTSDTNGGVIGMAQSGLGVEGKSNSSIGVGGVSNTDVGVYGATFDASVAGVEGVYEDLNSNTGKGSTQIGVWGDSGVSGSVGVLGTSDDGNSLFGVNNTVNHETLYVQNSSGFNGGTPFAARFAGPGSSTYCSIFRDAADNGTGDLTCTGTISPAVPVGGNRMVRLYTVEAADNWFEDAGSGQLANGSATIALDQVFAQTVNGDLDYHVFITPNGECEGLYVTNKTAHGFEVHELHKGHSNIAFDYRIMARRKGFENVRMQDVTADFAHMKRESDLLAARLEAGKAAQQARPKLRAPVPPKKSPWNASSAGNIPPTLPLSLAGATRKVK
ncbi:MAG: hypothetical protein WBQ10_02690 [Terriglobales bacterium]